MSGVVPIFGDREHRGARRIVSGVDRSPHTVSTPTMDADRFDALSRALTSAPSRRKTLGALLGALFASALPGSVLDPLAAAGRRTRKDRRHATRKDRRREAARLESGEVRASDVSAAACIAPGARGCPRTACCATRCKRKKKKCLPCPTGTSYCASQTACVAPGQCVVSCPQGTADCDGDGNCETNTTNSNQHCGGCDRPCGTGKSCVNSVCTDSATCNPACTGGRVCSNPSTNSCTCPDDKPRLCNGECTDPRSDKNHCWPNFDSCGIACPAGDGHVCCNGTCAFLPGCLAGSNMSDCQKNHCGTCGSPCTAEGFACCNGTCVANNNENCGNCGNNCTAQGLRCVGNTCVP